ncbi:GPR1/FUN34/yaaH protein [Penicillium malachiteum]|uniref:GPR1/FUN34/yaaH protein n=1 Tax=Penicillium malachiteum TaxID=1324776 RepID=UPI002546A397|nr:GPR1/FUN34/yaaH protein [Penicillium malachiteum]KAJ5728841.1 GPR1/FUN34/yaaH protein [Penicillium malachiteum]
MASSGQSQPIDIALPYPADSDEGHYSDFQAHQGRKKANPGPLGLCAFAFTVFLLGCIQMNCRGIPRPNIIIGPALAYGGLIQLLAGMWEMAHGNTFGATISGSYGGFWISFAVILIPGAFHIESSLVKADNGSHTMFDHALALYLIGWFIFTFLIALCSAMKAPITIFALTLTVDIAALLIALSYFYPHPDGAPNKYLAKAGGFFAILTAFLAWYSALAELANHENSFFVLPVGHFPWSKKNREQRNRGDRSGLNIV